MTRQLTITAAEWASVTDGTLWLVRERTDEWTWLPPAEFVQACAPCKRRLGHRWVSGDRNGLDYDYHPNERNHCPDCRIQLGQPCCECDGAGSVDGDRDADTDDAETVPCAFCDGLGFVILGYAYAVGGPLPIYGDNGDDGATGEHLYASAILGAVYLHAGLHLHTGLDITDRLAHYGPSEGLVGKWAIELRVVGS